MGQHPKGRGHCLRTGHDGAVGADLSNRHELQGRIERGGLRNEQHRRLVDNKRMPDAVSTIQQAILYRKGRSMMGGSGGMRTAVCPHWNEVSIDDIYSGSASGERFLSLHVLLGDVIIVQTGAYTQTAFKVST